MDMVNLVVQGVLPYYRNRQPGFSWLSRPLASGFTRMRISNQRLSPVHRAFIFTLVFGLFAGSAAASDDAAAILKWVPADAWGFAVVKSLDQIDKKAETLQKEFGLDIPPIRSSLMAMLPIATAFDGSRPIGVIALNVREMGEKAVAFLVPATDPAGLIAKLQPGDVVDGLTPCNLAGETIYAKALDKYVLASPSEACCRTILSSTKRLADDFASDRAAMLARGDVFVSVAVGAALKAYGNEAAGLAALAAGSVPGDPRQIEKWIASAGQIETLDLALTLDDKGLWFGWLNTAARDSDLSKYYAGSRTSDDLLVQWLPREDCLISVGGMTAGSRGPGGEDSLLSGMLWVAATNVLQPVGASPILNECAVLSRDVTRYAASISMIPAQGRSTLAAAVVLETNDPARVMENLRKLYRTVLAVSNDPEFDGIKKAIIHRTEAEVIGGRKIDTITVDPNLLAGAGVNIETLKQAELLLGRDLTVRFGPIGDKQVAVAAGGGQARFVAITQAVAGKLADSLKSDPGIRAVAENVCKPRTFECFIAIDHIVQAVRSQARAAGNDDPIPVDLPRLDSPAVFCGSVQGRAARWEIFLPKRLMVAAKQVSDRAGTSAPRNFDEEDDERIPTSRPATTAPAESTPTSSPFGV